MFPLWSPARITTILGGSCRLRTFFLKDIHGLIDIKWNCTLYIVQMSARQFSGTGILVGQVHDFQTGTSIKFECIDQVAKFIRVALSFKLEIKNCVAGDS